MRAFCRDNVAAVFVFLREAGQNVLPAAPGGG